MVKFASQKPVKVTAGVITIPMTGLVRPEHQNSFSLGKKYLHKRAATSNSPLSSAYNDIMYTVPLGIGTPPQLFNLAIDTGSPITWVLNKTCEGDCDSIFNKFNCAASSTCQPSPSSGHLNVSYSSGDGVVGDYVNDIFNLGSLNFQSLAGVVNHYSANLPPTVDGIMGLWYMLHTYRNIPENSPFLNTLKKTNALTQPVIGIWLKDSNSTEESAPGGEITFGGIDTTRFIGDITYINCDPISPWTIPVKSISVNGMTYRTTGALATIDTGTTAMYVPETVADAINSGIPGSVKMAIPINGVSWVMPCEGTTPVIFTFGDFKAVIPYTSFVLGNIKFRSQNTGAIYCASSAMFPIGTTKHIKEWLLGTVLLKNVYSIYDFGTNAATGGRIGFAYLTSSDAFNTTNKSTGSNNINNIDLGNGYIGGNIPSSSSRYSTSRVLQAVIAAASRDPLEDDSIFDDVHNSTTNNLLYSADDTETVAELSDIRHQLLRLRIPEHHKTQQHKSKSRLIYMTTVGSDRQVMPSRELASQETTDGITPRLEKHNRCDHNNSLPEVVLRRQTIKVGLEIKGVDSNACSAYSEEEAIFRQLEKEKAVNRRPQSYRPPWYKGWWSYDNPHSSTGRKREDRSRSHLDTNHLNKLHGMAGYSGYTGAFDHAHGRKENFAWSSLNPGYILWWLTDTVAPQFPKVLSDFGLSRMQPFDSRVLVRGEQPNSHNGWIQTPDDPTHSIKDLESRIDQIQKTIQGLDNADGLLRKELDFKLDMISQRVIHLEHRFSDINDDIKSMKKYITDGQWIDIILKVLHDEIPKYVAVAKDPGTGEIRVPEALWNRARELFVTKDQVKQSIDETMSNFRLWTTIDQQHQWMKFLNENERALHQIVDGRITMVSRSEFLKLVNAEASVIWTNIEKEVIGLLEQDGSLKITGTAFDSLSNQGQGHNSPTAESMRLSDVEKQIISKLIEEALARHSADVIAKQDYALFSAGGRIILKLTSPDYQSPEKPTNWGRLGLSYLFSPPTQLFESRAVKAILPDMHAGECWAMDGIQGQIGIRLARKIIITEVTIEHADPRVAFDPRSAPRELEIWRLVAPVDSTQYRSFMNRDNFAVGFGQDNNPKQRDSERKTNEDMGQSPVMGTWQKEGSPCPGATLLTTIEYEMHEDISNQRKLCEIEGSINSDSSHRPTKCNQLGLAQTFSIPLSKQNAPAFGVVVRVNSNWGQPDYTCLYRPREYRSLDVFVLKCPKSTLNFQDIHSSRRMTSTAFERKLSLLEESSRQLASTDFTTPRLYTSLLLENQIVPVRNAKPFEQNLFASNGGETIRNIKTREGADEFETTMELASALNEICQNSEIQRQLDQIVVAHEDVVSSIANLSATLAALEESNLAGETQEPVRQEGDEIMVDIVREEGEIFALEQLLSEKRNLLSQMQKELDDLATLPSAEMMDQDRTIVEEDPGLEAETAAKKIEIDNLDQRIQEQRRREEEQIAIYEELLRENNELTSMQHDAEANTEEDSSPYFNEITRLWQKAADQDGDTVVEPKGIREAYLKLERLLDGLERSQRHIVNLDVLHQLSSTLIDNCADPMAPEFDPPRTDSDFLTARALQVIIKEGGSVSLTHLKDQISKEAVERGATSDLGIQVVYKLVASYLIQIDRSKTPNLVSFT
ncbi:hypothetical protein BGX27_007566 [Mortierella sp. AM989]|nr:hypothetical protein BGX27_007566 [Mortierella sp. AM989]